MPINLLINATALNSRGGLTVILQFVKELEEYIQCQNDFRVVLLVSMNELVRYKGTGLEIIFSSAPKEGFYKKYKFEKNEIPKIIKEYDINCYLSLSNTYLRINDISQYVFIHQSLQVANLKLSEVNFGIYLKYNVLLNLIYKFSLRKKVNGIIVQTNWMKQAIQNKYQFTGSIKVICPKITSNHSRLDPLEITDFEDNKNIIRFIYPTSHEKYKNIKKLMEAIELYNNEYDNKVVLYLTQDGVSTDNVKFIGKIPYESMYWVYKKMDALIFPSLTETLGLPLQEALDNKLDILVADLPYAKEICGEQATYFDPRDVKDIVHKIQVYVNQEKCEKELQSKKTASYNYMDFLNFIKHCELQVK